MNFEGSGGAIFCNILTYGSKIVCLNKGHCHALIVDDLGKVTPISIRDKLERETAYSNFGVTKSFLIGSNTKNIIDA